MSDAMVHALPSLLSVLVSVTLAMLVMARANRMPVHWALTASLLALALAQVGNGFSLLAEEARTVLHWRRVASAGEMLMPLGWLIFSLTFARSNARDLLRDWKGGLWGSAVLTAIFLALVGSDRLFGFVSGGEDQPFFITLGPSGRIYAAVYLIAQVQILANLEQTIRHADEQVRWYVKFPVVGLGLLCVYFLYQMSDMLLYSVWRTEMASLSGAVSIVACALIGYGLLRRPIPNVQIYISRKVVSGSLSFLIVGSVLVATGVIAWFIRDSGLPGGMVLSAMFVLLACTGLMFVLLSASMRQGLGRFVERHFFPHKYDYRTRWLEATETIGAPGTPEQIGWRAVHLFRGIFGAKTLAIWMTSDVEQRGWSRIGGHNVQGTPGVMKEVGEIQAWLDAHEGPLDVDSVEGMPEVLDAELRATESRLIVPLKGGHHAIGWVSLGARQDGTGYSQQDRDLLRCMVAQVADRLQHLALADRLIMAREMEAFYEYSTFFLHDLKNFTATLSLVMQNAERHGSDPEFQRAAMRSVGATVRKMTALMGTVAALSRDPRPKLVPVDLNALADEVLKGFDRAAGASLVRHVEPVPMVEADPDQLQQVLLNLILNAQEAVGPEGQITIRTQSCDGTAQLIVEDNGCGMDRATMSGLFRPFRTTKGRGLGIGLYQCRKILEAHGGVLEVDSDIGKGTRFLIGLNGCREKRGVQYV